MARLTKVIKCVLPIARWFTKDGGRPSRAEIHMSTAYLWSTRALCKLADRDVGAIITTGDMKRVLSHGYNGPPRQLPNDACRGVTGNCGCVHAETNAIAFVDGSIPNKTMFVTLEPCETCANLIAQANIAKVVYCDEYRNHAGLDRLNQCGIEVVRMIPVIQPKQSLEQLVQKYSGQSSALAIQHMLCYKCNDWQRCPYAFDPSNPHNDCLLLR